MANLKATFALLPDAEMQNRASAAAVLVHGASGGRLRWPRLPPHVSLKQPFSIESLATIERYFDQFAADTAPIAATLGRVQTQPTSPNTPESVVWVSIDQPSRLRAMHERLNRELRKVVTDAQAPLDGEGYEFHMTLGFLPGPELSLPGGVPGLSGANTTFRELGLFVYDGLPKAGWQCMRYKVLPLTGRAESGLTEESRINWEHVRRSTIEYYEKRPSLGDAWDNEPAGVFPDAAPEEARLGAALCKVVAAKHALELGCGTGAATRVAASTAASVLALDSSESCIALARQAATLPNVDYRVWDAFELDGVDGSFSAGYASGFFHLIPQSHYDAFFRQFHAKLAPGSPVFLSATHARTLRAKKRLFRPEASPDVFCARTLTDGSAYAIVNNEFDAEKLRSVFGPRGTDLEVCCGDAWWWVTYRT